MRDASSAEAEQRVDEALRESEARFRNMADHAPVMMWVTDPSGACLYLNRAWYAFTGQTEAQSAGFGWLDAVHPDDRIWSGQAFLDANSNAESFRLDYRLRRADGAYRWSIDAAAPRFGAGGEFLGYVGSVIDIDERREAEDRLALSEEKLRLALEVAEIGQWDVETATGTMFWQPRVKAMFGISSDVDVTLQDFYDNVHPEDREKTRAAYEAASDPDRRPLYEVEYRTIGKEDNVLRWVAAKGRGIFDGDGRCVRVIGTAIDVTARKADELRLRELNETLEARVAERTAELEAAHEALRQSQKMEAVGQLTGGLAHDFNNLLAGIQGSLELMDKRLAQGRTSDVELYLRAAQESARRAAALTQRLLAFSRRQTLAPKVTNVGALVVGMKDLIERTVGPAIAVESVPGADLWPVLVDANQLENALLNLAINARDAMPDGGRLTIETANHWLDDRTARAQDVEPGPYVSLCVSDTGTGMSPDVVARAFDPFFTTKPLGVGTGLGLSMIYGFVRQSGGQAHISSTEGEGTTLCLHLPRHMGEVDEAEDTAGAGPALAPADTEKTVLVVDDEAVVRMLMVDVLEEMGLEVLEAGNGASALKILQSDASVDILITDVGLPGGLNGRQVADAARALRPDLRVIFVTGYAENAVLNHGHLEQGMQVVTKPFAVEDLTRRVQMILAGG